MKIGMKMMMISVHSSRQPRMKMMNCARIMNCSGVMSSDSTHFSISSWPPSSANAAEKIPEPTNSQHTIALVLAVRKHDSLISPPNSRVVRPRTVPADAPARRSPPRPPPPVGDEAINPGQHEPAERAHRRRLGRGRQADHDRAKHGKD